MDKYIKRDDVLALAREYYSQGLKEEAVPVKAIKNIPSVDVAEVKRGKWVNGECSECGGDAPFWPMATTYYRSNFCPNCGADMRQEETDG